MVRSHPYPLVTFQALLLLLSLYCFVYLSSYPPSPHYGPGFGPTFPSDFNATLSDENPVFRYNATYEAIWIEICSLHTNDTPVTLSVLGESGILLNITNVTSISGFSMIAAREQSGDFWLQVVRLQSDAYVNITLKYWKTIPPPLISRIFPWHLIVMFALSVPAFLYSFYSLGIITLIGLRGKAQWKFGRGPASIIILIVLGVACCIPQTQGNLHGYFLPVYTQQVLHENYSLTLNESSPSWSLELAVVDHEAVYGTTFKIYNFSESAYPISVVAPDVTQENIVLGKVEDTDSWWFSFTIQINDTSTLKFQRTDTDLELGFSIETKYSTYGVRIDPFLPNLLIFFGFLLWIPAIALAIQLECTFGKKSHRNESDDQLLI